VCDFLCRQAAKNTLVLFWEIFPQNYSKFMQMKKYVILLIALAFLFNQTLTAQKPPNVDPAQNSFFSAQTWQTPFLKSSPTVQNGPGKRAWASTSIQYNTSTGAVISLDSSRIFYGSNNLQNEIMEWRMTGPQTFELSRRILFEYDNNDSLTVMLFQDWENTAWVNDAKLSSNYDLQGKLLSRTSQTWDGSAWASDFTTQFTYNANNQLITVEEPYQRRIYEYDANGHRIAQLEQLFLANVWENSSQFLFSNDASGKLLTTTFQRWLANTWANDQQYNFTYNSSGNLVFQFNEKWNVNAWGNSGQYYFTYTPGGLPDSLTTQVWANNAWENNFQSITTYDGDDCIAEYTISLWSNAAWRKIFYGRNYCEAFSAVQNYANYAFEFSISPNPAAGVTFIKTGAEPATLVKVFDAQGRLVRTQNLRGVETEALDLLGISNGVYMVQVIGKNGVGASKALIIGN